MKKKLYYVIEKELMSDDQTLSGNKTVTVYEILDNVPKQLTTVEGEISDKSTDLIQNYLDDNGMGDDDFEFIQL